MVLSIKKDEILAFTIIWLKLEAIMLNKEINPCAHCIRHKAQEWTLTSKNNLLDSESLVQGTERQFEGQEVELTVDNIRIV